MNLWICIRKALNMLSEYWYTPFNKIKFRLNGVKYDQGLKVRGSIFIFKHNESSEITFGSNVMINSAPWANPTGCGNRTYIQMVGSGKLTIGNGCGISNTAITCAESVQIGDNVMIGAGCKIFDTDFHAQNFNDRIHGNYLETPIKTAPIVIDNGAFIGAGCYILKGIRIGTHSIVGAGSVVTHDIPAFEIWAGNPAKFIRKISEESV